jgi:hypothetical protein
LSFPEKVIKVFLITFRGKQQITFQQPMTSPADPKVRKIEHDPVWDVFITTEQSSGHGIWFTASSGVRLKSGLHAICMVNHTYNMQNTFKHFTLLPRVRGDPLRDLLLVAEQVDNAEFVARDLAGAHDLLPPRQLPRMLPLPRPALQRLPRCCCHGDGCTTVLLLPRPGTPAGR